MTVDGHLASALTARRAMRRWNLLQPIDYQGERREPAKARKAAFAAPPTSPNQVWQLDFSEYENITGGIWCLGWAPLSQLLTREPGHRRTVPIKLVTDNGGEFKGVAFNKYITSRPELLHIHTRAKSPGQNGVRERAFGSLKYEHLYRAHEQITTVEDLHREAERYRGVFNHIRPHEALGMRQPIEILTDPLLHPIHKRLTEDLGPEA